MKWKWPFRRKRKHLFDSRGLLIRAALKDFPGDVFQIGPINAVKALIGAIKSTC